MKIAAVIQARLSSHRFPGKVLHGVAGKPLLAYLLERLERCRALDGIVVATSVSASDDPLAAFCDQHSIACHRGPLLDVADRIREVIAAYALDAFVRVNGDSPFLDPQLIEEAVTRFRGSDADLVTNVLRRTYPAGQSVEVVRGDPFGRACACMDEPEDREHVTRYFYRHSTHFNILSFESPVDHSAVRLVVDTAADMDRFTAMIARMDRPAWQYSLADLLNLNAAVLQAQVGSAA